MKNCFTVIPLVILLVGYLTSTSCKLHKDTNIDEFIVDDTIHLPAFYQKNNCYFNIGLDSMKTLCYQILKNNNISYDSVLNDVITIKVHMDTVGNIIKTGLGRNSSKYESLELSFIELIEAQSPLNPIYWVQDARYQTYEMFIFHFRPTGIEIHR